MLRVFRVLAESLISAVMSSFLVWWFASTHNLSPEAQLVAPSVTAFLVYTFTVYRLGAGKPTYCPFAWFFNLWAKESELELYAKAGAESETGNYDKGVWSKALISAQGDEKKRKAVYIERRVEQLKSES